MTLKSDVHVFTGMQKDLDVAKHKAEFLYDAHNIRFTAIDGDTLFCITNEKSTQEIESSSNTVIEGSYLGHCVIDDIVVLFTKIRGQQSKDCIYKIKINTENQNEYDITTLYKGNLNFNFNNPIETLGIFENKDIQKVYWIDGLNQPRVIRIDGNATILSDIDDPNANTQFDFVPSLALEEEVTVERYEGDGMFAPGVIQYAFAYYNKYGRESNIFYTTPLHYISFSDRGGSPEDRIANSFRITVTNVEKNKFDYLRVFSIHRTSIDAIPTCKRVVDIELSILDSTTATFIDNGTIGDIIDNTELLYIGGENIVPYTMTQKDNTLFFGNYEITRLPISSELKAHIKNSGSFDTVKDRKLDAYEVIPSSRYYEYVYSKEDRRGFKIGEHYRLGLQFQHKSGKWSEPIFIQDYTVKQVEDGLDRYSKTVIENHTNSYIDVSSSPYWDELQNNGYIKYREVCVFPNILDRLVLTQGIVNPTVFNFRDRSDGAPFAQSSWFFRPNPVNDEDLDKIPEFRHNHILGTRNHLNAEVFGQVELGNDTTYNYPRTDSYRNTYHTGVTFGVDQSILTMHSPEIEFDDNFHFLDYTQYKFRLVGVSWLGANIGALDIQTSSASGSGKSIYDYPVYLAKRKLTSTDANQSLITSYYNDVEVDENYKIKTESGSQENLGWIYHNYIVYPWHKTGSLNNDVTRPSTMINNENQNLYIGAQSAVLKTKKMSNLKYFFSNTFFNDPVTTININKVQLFADDQVTLKKIPYLENTEAFKTVSYYGNVDTAISATGAGAYIPIRDNDVTFNTISYAGNSKLDKAAIRIKYKSTKHLVFSLSSPDQKTHILPVLDGTPTYHNLGDPVPYWFKEEERSKEEEHNEHSNTKLVYVQLYQDMTLTEAQANPTVNTALNNFLTEDNINKDGLIVLKSPTIADKYQLYTVAYSGNALSIVTYHNTGNKIYIYPNLGGNYTAFTESGSGGTLDVASDTTIDPDDVILLNDYTVSQRVLYSVTTGINNPTYPYLFLAELYREPNSETDFGGNTEEALKSNLWLPAGEPKKIPQNGHITLRYEYGDTWYQRYDCLKTYPFTLEDENSIVEIGSFECETRVNVEGRYDRNRGENNNLVMTPINFNLLNKVYSQSNNFFNYRILDKDFYRLNKFPNTITWTKAKTNAAIIDLWTNVTAAETFDLDGIKGQINALRTFNDKIYGFQDNALSLISFNPRVQISTSDGVPIEITNSKKMEGKVYISDIIGCTNKWTITVTPSGIYFIDSNSKELYNIGQQLGTVSGTHGFSNWFKDINVDKYRTFYDYNDKDLYILDTPTNDIDNSLVFSEYLGQFSSFMNYGKAATMFNIDNNYYAFTNDDDTMMYRIKGSDDSYNTFFGTTYPFDITFISNADASEDKIFTNLEMRADFYVDGALDHRKNFDYIQIYNEYQNTNKVNLTFNYKVASNLKKKFRIWRMDIPRDYGSMNRIRNTWTTVKLGMNNTEDLSKTYMKLHDLVVQYYI